MATIPQMLKEIGSRGLSQEKIGVKIGLSQASVSRLMRGETECTYAHGLKIKQLYETYIPAEKWTEQRAKDQIDSLKKALVVAQGNFDESQAHVKQLEKTIYSMKARRCWLCRVRLFFRG